MIKKTMPWVLGYALIVLLSLDFWNWGRSQPVILGMPYWVIAFILLNLTLSAYYFLFSRKYWGD
jgi:hypothetical protein